MERQLLRNVQVDEILAPVSNSSSTDSNSDRLDMAGFEGVIFVAVITDSAATGVALMTIQENTADSDTGMAALSGATATATCTVNDDLNNQLLIVDVYKPKEQYLQATLTSATANIAYGNTIAIRYGASIPPITQDTDIVLASSLVVTPADA